MSHVKYLLIGILFGIVMFKSEAASWFRIFEMFQFQSFHMYGIIGSALLLGIPGVWLVKKYELKSRNNEVIKFTPKTGGYKSYLFGGILFGLGWALAGSCPGPIYTLIGAGYWPVLVVLLGALVGTLSYGIAREKLPH